MVSSARRHCDQPVSYFAIESFNHQAIVGKMDFAG
jgi:hypothetical protein